MSKDPDDLTAAEELALTFRIDDILYGFRVEVVATDGTASRGDPLACRIILTDSKKHAPLPVEPSHKPT